MRQGSQGEGILIDILALEQQFANKVSAADVMHQVAEFFAAEWVVAEILNDGAPVGVGMRLFDLVFRQPRISLEQQGPDLVGPDEVHDFLVRQNGIRRRTAAAHEHDEEELPTRGQEAGANL